MDRFTLTLAAAATFAACALAGGCAENGSRAGAGKASGGNSAAAAPASKANYFEMKKGGKTYVFSRVDSMNAFREGRGGVKTSTEQLGGKVVVVENRSYTDYNRLVGEYKKAHSIK